MESARAQSHAGGKFQFKCLCADPLNLLKWAGCHGAAQSPGITRADKALGALESPNITLVTERMHRVATRNRDARPREATGEEKFGGQRGMGGAFTTGQQGMDCAAGSDQ